MLTVRTLQCVRSESDFDIFWEKVEMKRAELDVEGPCVARKRKFPKRLELGSGEAEFHVTAKSFYRQMYFEALDLAVSSITDRFDQPGFRIYSGD